MARKSSLRAQLAYYHLSKFGALTTQLPLKRHVVLVKFKVFEFSKMTLRVGIAHNK